jgi:hypothetical protein
MEQFTIWDGVLLVVVAYVAVMALVRLMIAHRGRIMQQIQREVLAEQLRQKQEKIRQRDAQAQDNSAA